MLEKMAMTAPAVFIPLLADTTIDTTGSVWIDLARTLGIAGILCWYLYHTTTITIPRASEKHAEVIQKITVEHNCTVEKICSEFQNSLKEERAARREEVAELKSTIRCRNFLPSHIDGHNEHSITHSENRS